MPEISEVRLTSQFVTETNKDRTIKDVFFRRHEEINRKIAICKLELK